MNEQLKKVIDPIKTFWGKLTKKTKIVIFSCLGAAVVLAIILSLAMNRMQYAVLYSGLGSDEIQTITNELRTQDVAYRTDNGTIYVDKAKENSVRMQLATEGYPKSAPNYDFFTKNVGVMTTDEERKIIEQYQLESRLSAVVKTINSVDTATVTISLPQSSSYAWDDNKQAASASVAVKLRNGETLDTKQVNGIKQLISKSVPNMKAADVTVMDNSTGEELSASSENDSGSTQISLSEFKLKIEKQYEDNLQNKITGLLSRAYGQNNVSVSVKSKMDLDKKIQDIVTYTPSTSDGKGIVSHSEEYHEVGRDDSAAGGVAGTTSNADTTTTTYPGVSVSSGVITAKDSKTYDYLVNKVQEQIQSNAAALDDLTVAVVVTTNGMTDAKKQDLTALIANAAAVDQSKVAIMATMPSAVASSQANNVQANGLPQMLMNNPIILIAAGVLLLLILLIVLLAAKKRKARRAEMLANLQQLSPEEVQAQNGEEMPEGEESEENAEPEEGAEQVEEEPVPSIEEVRSAGSGKEEQIKNQLQDFSSKNPEIAAQLLRSWLRGDEIKHE